MVFDQVNQRINRLLFDIKKKTAYFEYLKQL
jgi:hypothetical protein